MCADKEVAKISGSGITIGGTKTLEEYIDEEKGEEISTELHSQRFSLYNKPTAKIVKGKGKSGNVRIFTRRELNKTMWEKMMTNISKSNVSDLAKLDLAILTVLLSGKEMIGREIKDSVLLALPDCDSKRYTIRFSYIVTKTLLSKLLRRQNFGNYSRYRLETAALDLTPQELHVFVYKKKDQIVKVLSDHKSLQAYFELDDLQFGRKPKPTKTEKAEETIRVPAKEEKEEIIKSIEKAISKVLGIDVNVNGKIEIVFRLGG